MPLGILEKRGWATNFYSDEFGWCISPAENLYAYPYAHRALWLQPEARGFRDLRSDLIREVLFFMEDSTPPCISDWGWGSDKGDVWWFQVPHIRIRLCPSLDTRKVLKCEIMSSSAASESSILQGVKDEINTLLEQNEESMTSFHNIGILILQIIEAASTTSDELVNKMGQHQWPANSKAEQEGGNGDDSKPKTTTSDDKFARLMSLTPQRIAAIIPEEYTIVAIEPVRQRDLTKSWLDYRVSMRTQAEKEQFRTLRNKVHPHQVKSQQRYGRSTKSTLVDEIITPFVTFHGTRRSNVPSIITHGFQLPGTTIDGKTITNPRSNSVIQRGIYSSQSPEFAVSFSKCHESEPTPPHELPGLRLFVCATIMGRTYTGPNVHGKLHDGYDAHFDGSNEYIVYDPRAILPCYVVHLDLGTEKATTAIKQVQLNPRFQRKRQPKKIDASGFHDIYDAGYPDDKVGSGATVVNESEHGEEENDLSGATSNLVRRNFRYQSLVHGMTFGDSIARSWLNVVLPKEDRASFRCFREGEVS